ncbi:hypothetical protein CEXT_319671 [Caerostris extrusa]|uniref:Uncharacterized protein n=1 Tax=Caerostris extrusa TaxID=172846 RepID=A0AAV4VAJ8_CAEEX|nr:hypothetical protein CEXT_319671 [Caerostris extrusa]
MDFKQFWKLSNILMDFKQFGHCHSHGFQAILVIDILMADRAAWPHHSHDFKSNSVNIFESSSYKHPKDTVIVNSLGIVPFRHEHHSPVLTNSSTTLFHLRRKRRALSLFLMLSLCYPERNHAVTSGGVKRGSSLSSDLQEY